VADVGGVSLKNHFDALNELRERMEAIARASEQRSQDIIRALEQRSADNIAAWLKEKALLHNNLFQAWEKATAEDRATFVKTATFEALRDAFGVNTATTAKALTLAEGKSKGYATVVAAASFVVGIAVAAASAFAMFRHGG